MAVHSGVRGLVGAIILILGCANFTMAVEMLNVSYDPTREFYEAFNKAFIADWKAKTGETVIINQSHGGSGKQARSVIDGLEADVVTLALAYDIDAIAAKTQWMPPDWQKRLPNNSCPYTSTIVFLVRKGNPKLIKDWGDLVKPGIEVIMPNPKTSGGARWIYLAAWAFAREKFTGDEQKIRAFMAVLFKNVPVLDSGARGSTTTFVQRGIGDVLLTWENEAFLAMEKMKGSPMEIAVPSFSIRAEPPVALIEKMAEKHTTQALAKAYLDHLYSDTGQELAARYFYRPSSPAIAAKHADRFVNVKMCTIDGDFGGWAQAQKIHFDDGGTFDQLYQPGK
ncbi:MAG TPA: sulfate ABC transporter substrate-binding protein [Candidatus Hydrogenedentes bacterium]|nr:sulfate ABC transporter substrate-binding protein [Candidatus Hydrogenedentota bacterium]